MLSFAKKKREKSPISSNDQVSIPALTREGNEPLKLLKIEIYCTLIIETGTFCSRDIGVVSGNLYLMCQQH